MKKLFSILLSVSIFIFGCNSKPELKKDDALQIINQELNYPKVIDYDIFCSDPDHAKKLMDAGLETSGFISVQKSQKLKNTGNPLIQFSENSQPYLLPTKAKDKALDIQKVKIADEEIKDIQIKSDRDNNNTVWVEYTSVYKNITPFSVLIKKNFEESISHRVQFSRTEQGWIIQKPIL